MYKSKINAKTKTGTIYSIIFKLLEENPEGIPWSKLTKMVESADPSLHPKTINGCVWKLIAHYPEKVYKPSKGLFRLKKYK